MKKYSLFAALVLALAVAGCARPTPAPPPTVAAEEPTAQAPEETPSAIVLTDAMGVEITLAAPAASIISTAPAVTEDLFAIGAGGQVVGVTEFCNYPPEMVELGLTTVGGFSDDSFSLETMVALAPDFVVADASIQGNLIPDLRAAGLTVFAINPTTLEQVMDTLITLGRLTGHQEEAAALVEDMQARLEAVQETLAAVPDEDKARVYYEIWNDPYMVPGPSFIQEVITLAGGVDIFADVETPWATVSEEEIIARDPEVIIAPETYMFSDIDAEAIIARPGWEAINAVRAGRVYFVTDDIISRPGPRLVEALETVAGFLYPEYFE